MSAAFCVDAVPSCPIPRQVPAECWRKIRFIPKLKNNTLDAWSWEALKVHSHITSVFFFDFCVSCFKMQTITANTITCCHGPHSWRLMQTQTLCVNKCLSNRSQPMAIGLCYNYLLKEAKLKRINLWQMCTCVTSGFSVCSTASVASNSPSNFASTTSLCLPRLGKFLPEVKSRNNIHARCYLSTKCNYDWKLGNSVRLASRSCKSPLRFRTYLSSDWHPQPLHISSFNLIHFNKFHLRHLLFDVSRVFI